MSPRIPLTDEGRRKAGKTRSLRAKLARAVRTLAPDEAPAAPQSLDDAVTIAALVSRSVLVGTVDPATARETIRALGEFRHLLEKRDLARELSELRQQVKALKHAR